MPDRRATPQAADAPSGSTSRVAPRRSNTPEQTHQFGFQRRVGRLRHRAPWMNHDVPSRRNLRFIAPQDFPDAAANAIPHDRATQGLLDADAKAADRACRGCLDPKGLVIGAARRGCLLRAEENCKLGARTALTRAVYSFVFD